MSESEGIDPSEVTPQMLALWKNVQPKMSYWRQGQDLGAGFNSKLTKLSLRAESCSGLQLWACGNRLAQQHVQQELLGSQRP